MEGSATIKDIAKECGVSIATVSRVINKSEKVLPGTREKVEAAIRKYHYAPNAIAKSLVSRRSTSIGVTLPDISNPYFSSLFCEIEETAHREGYSVFLCNTMFHSGLSGERSEQKEQDYFKRLMETQVAGAIVAGGQLDLLAPREDYLEALARFAQSVPLVILSRPIPGIQAVFVDREENTGMTQAIHFLASLGHERIAFLGGEEGVTVTQKRLRAYRETLQSLKLPACDDLVFLSDYYVADGYRAAKRLLEKQAPFTAVLTVNDSVAVGALRAFEDCGVRVPQEVSLISCEEFRQASYYTPRLTSVDRHSDLFGRRVIQALLAGIRGETPPELEPEPSNLMVRESCMSVRGEFGKT